MKNNYGTGALIIAIAYSPGLFALDHSDYCGMAEIQWQKTGSGNFPGCAIEQVLIGSGNWDTVYLHIPEDGSSRILSQPNTGSQYRMEVKKDGTLFRFLDE